VENSDPLVLLSGTRKAGSGSEIANGDPLRKMTDRVSAVVVIGVVRSVGRAVVIHDQSGVGRVVALHQANKTWPKLRKDGAVQKLLKPSIELQAVRTSSSPLAV
jgi:hypothetical protein